MSGGEVFVGLLAAAFAAWYWGYWLYAAYRTDPLARPAGRRAALVLCLILSHGVVLAILLTAADPVVRTSTGYILLFLAVEAAALAAVTSAVSVIGFDPLDDAIRRPNPAAAWATAGLWLGTSVAVAGANVGRGATLGTTLGPLVLAVVAILVLLALFAAATGGLAAVRLDRDVPSGVRVAGLLLAWGLVLGRSVAGDWESVRDTWRDFFVQGGPALLLLAFAIPVEWLLQPTVRRAAAPRAAGVVPAAAYVAVAVAWVAWLGRPSWA